MNAARNARRLAWLAFAVLAAAADAQQPAGKLEVEVMDVGQADAILVRCPDGRHRMLIDSGDVKYPGSSKAFKESLAAETGDGPKRLDVVVATHPHTDHIGNMLWVLRNFEVGTYVDNGEKADTATFGRLDALRRDLQRKKRLHYVNGRGHALTAIEFCPLVKAEIIEPWARGKLDDTNARSAVVRLAYGEKVLLFAGDLEESAEEILLHAFSEAERGQIDADVLKVGHHGSDTSSAAPFIRAVSPEFAVISCGAKDIGTNQRYKHPRLSTVRHYAEWFKGAPPSLHPPAGILWAYDGGKWVPEPRPDGVWATPNDGTVTILCDGRTLEARRSKP